MEPRPFKSRTQFHSSVFSMMAWVHAVLPGNFKEYRERIVDALSHEQGDAVIDGSMVWSRYDYESSRLEDAKDLQQNPLRGVRMVLYDVHVGYEIKALVGKRKWFL